MRLSMTKLRINSDVSFMGIGMKYISNPPHLFTSSDNITLMKDNTAIKVMVDSIHVFHAAVLV